MGQSEVLNLLQKIKRPLSRTEIALNLKQDSVLVSHSIQRLVRSEEIKVIEIDRSQAMKLYKCKRRMRLYYYS